MTTAPTVPVPETVALCAAGVPLEVISRSAVPDTVAACAVGVPEPVTVLVAVPDTVADCAAGEPVPVIAPPPPAEGRKYVRPVLKIAHGFLPNSASATLGTNLGTHPT